VHMHIRPALLPEAALHLGPAQLNQYELASSTWNATYLQHLGSRAKFCKANSIYSSNNRPSGAALFPAVAWERGRAQA
jgi:hypothetical protein